MFEKLEEFRKIKAAYDKKLKKEGGEIVRQIIAHFFEQNPQFTGLRWKQYTPYFNDGEACSFSIHAIDCRLSPIDEIEGFDPDEGEEDTSSNGRWTEDGEYGLKKGPSRTALQKLEKEFSKSQDLLEAAFGDHVSILAERGKDIVVTKYQDHE